MKSFNAWTKGILLFTLLAIAIPGCARSSLNDTEASKVNQSTENVTVVADNLRTNPETVPHADILDDQVEVIDHAVGLDEKDITELEDKGLNTGATVSPEGLATDPVAEAEKSEEQKTKDIKEIDESRAGVWEWLTGGAAVTLITGLVGFAIRTAANAMGYGGVVRVIDGVASKVPVIGGVMKRGKEMEAKIGDLTATVEGSMVGRHALKAADKMLADNEQLGSIIGKLTNGQGTTLEELFTHLAAAHHVDSDHVNHDGVKKILDEVKHKLETRGGIAAKVADLIDRYDDKIT